MVVQDLKSPKGESGGRSKLSKASASSSDHRSLSSADLLNIVLTYLYYDMCLVEMEAFRVCLEKQTHKPATRPGFAVANFPLKRFVEALEKNKKNEHSE